MVFTLTTGRTYGETRMAKAVNESIDDKHVQHVYTLDDTKVDEQSYVSRYNGQIDLSKDTYT